MNPPLCRFSGLPVLSLYAQAGTQTGVFCADVGAGSEKVQCTRIKAQGKTLNLSPCINLCGFAALGNVEQLQNCWSGLDPAGTFLWNIKNRLFPVKLLRIAKLQKIIF